MTRRLISGFPLCLQSPSLISWLNMIKFDNLTQKPDSSTADILQVLAYYNDEVAAFILTNSYASHSNDTAIWLTIHIDQSA